ncbi:MAG: SusD/RagB family nutrient-binding outer membrane lipoprotein [Bacteroidales bacterium]|nr:SusD/RagB family nutrient-binding outer membrane lipoprotein [Bacteroidales bacterium]
MKSSLPYITFALILSLFFNSCTKDFKEINTDPYVFTTASDGSLFNGVIESLVPSGNEQMYINNEILYKQTQLAALTKEAWGNFTIGTESMWSNYYHTLPAIRELEKRFKLLPDSAEANNMRAMLKIALAYKTFKMTDIFGDMPFLDAGYGYQDLEYLRPKFDSQESIYTFLLGELKWCDENIDVTAISEEPFPTFSGFDPLFRGDMLKWQKFANSLRLRYALRMSEKKPDLAGEIIKGIVENERPIFLGYDFTTYLGESACLWPAQIGFKNVGLSWSFLEHENLRMGSNIWHQLSYNDSIDGSGIFDPRAYIFFETNNVSKWVSYPQIPEASTPPSGGIPYGTQRDVTGSFGIKGETCIYSPFNYFFAWDENFMPIPLITGAEINFILAEAYFRGIGLPQDPNQGENEYMNGLNASVTWWMEVASKSKLPSSGMSFPDQIQIPPGLGQSTVQSAFGFWNVTTDEEKLAFIYTQRWLDAFRQPMEAYALSRRTGMTPREGDPIHHYRLPYPPSEVEYNTANWAEAVANQGGDSPETKLWWIP